MTAGKELGPESAPEGQAPQRQPDPKQATVPTLLHAETLWVKTQCSNPPVQGRVMEGTDNQRAGEQGRPVRQKLYQGVAHNSTGALLAKDSPERTAMKIRKVKELRPNVSSHFNISTAAPSMTNTDAKKTLNRTMAKRQEQLIHQQRTPPLPRLSRAG